MKKCSLESVKQEQKQREPFSTPQSPSLMSQGQTQQFSMERITFTSCHLHRKYVTETKKYKSNGVQIINCMISFFSSSYTSIYSDTVGFK